jgi:hypothetical protein
MKITIDDNTVDIIDELTEEQQNQIIENAEKIYKEVMLGTEKKGITN